MCLCTTCEASARGGQRRRVWDPLELELQMTVSRSLCVCVLWKSGQGSYLLSLALDMLSQVSLVKYTVLLIYNEMITKCDLTQQPGSITVRLIGS